MENFEAANMEIEEELEVERTIHNSNANETVIFHENSTIAPVIIEELDEDALNSMDVDMAEFVEAKAVEIQEVSKSVVGRPSSYSPEPHIVVNYNVEADQDMSAEEEELLTKQFLNGELTFSEYSLRMDRSFELETEDIDYSRDETEETTDEVDSQLDTSGKKEDIFSQVRQKRKRRNLPPALQGLMGEANLRYARGETELATQICMEIIRQVPSAPEPYHTLAMIYENDQSEKSLQFALIAAHLSPKDADQWMRLANLSLESGNIKQAVTCYSKAIQASPKDETLYEARAQLQERNGDKKAYLRGYSRLLHQLEPEDGEKIIKYAKLLAKYHMQDNNIEQALEAMENIFLKCSELITLEEVNIMTEVLIGAKQFKRCLNILVKYTSIWVKYKSDITITEDTNQSEGCKIESCDMPDDVVVDLKAKFLVALIELNEIDIADRLLPKFYSNENPEISGDLFLDVAEALMGKQKFKHALILLDPLLKSTNYSLPAVWLRHAECWVGCNDIHRAIKSYEVVKTLSPQHLSARLTLAKLYKLIGKFDKAIEVLQQDPESDALDPNVIYQRTLLLLNQKRYDEYFQSGMLLFLRHCVTIRSKTELNAIARVSGVRQRLETLRLHRLSRGEKFEDENVPEFINTSLPSAKDEFLLFLQMCKLAHKLKKYGLLQRLCFTALTSKKFEKRNSHMMFLALLSCIYNNDSYYGYNIVREFVRVYPSANCWNLLNMIIQRAEDSRHNRFIMRLLGREDVSSYLNIMHANNCLVSGTYKYALNDYISLFRIMPNSLLALLIAITMFQMSCQKLSTKKNHLVVQAIAFMTKYSRLRGKGGEQEVDYNTGRAFHQLGLLPGAIYFYKRVLETEPEDVIKQNEDLLDLRKEAAYNLHLIYLQSENPHLARMYLENYIIV